MESINTTQELESLYEKSSFSRELLLSHPLATDRMLFHGMRSGMRAAWEHPSTSLLWVTCAGSTRYLHQLWKDPALGIASGLFIQEILLKGFDAAYGTTVHRDKSVGAGVPEELRPVLEWLLDSWLSVFPALGPPLSEWQILMTRVGMESLLDWMELTEEKLLGGGDKDG